MRPGGQGIRSENRNREWKVFRRGQTRMNADEESFNAGIQG